MALDLVLFYIILQKIKIRPATFVNKALKQAAKFYKTAYEIQQNSKKSSLKNRLRFNFYSYSFIS